MSIVPPFPQHYNIYSIYDTRYAVLSKEEGDTLFYLYVSMEYIMHTKCFNVRVYVLQDGVWRMQTSATTKTSSLLYDSKPMLVNNKIYFFVQDKSAWSGVLLLDLSATSFSAIKFPQGVNYGCLNTKLSRADDASSVYLIKLKEFQLRIWLCKGDNWSLVDTICLHDMVANLRMSDRIIDNEQNPPIWIREVGDNAEFMFLMMSGCLLYLDIKCRKLRIWSEDEPSDPIHPFMMFWPPKFPALKDDPTRFVFCP
ncbi:hypothetical protein CFC21_085902 [Triticum aestivum]|uniref:F-box protein AT5G49610-like beta-propeller domain-containing protein n=2 Tax=Triticum aestivum TaxID=4565 RepID=A0A3B6PEN4_WHEAT|nr:hypothetical protein CFC21_085902 [Triticum aestivum]